MVTKTDRLLAERLVNIADGAAKQALLCAGVPQERVDAVDLKSQERGEVYAAIIAGAMRAEREDRALLAEWCGNMAETLRSIRSHDFTTNVDLFTQWQSRKVLENLDAIQEPQP